MNVRGIKIKIEGKWRVAWTSHGSAESGSANSTQLVRDKGILLSEDKQFIPAVGAPSTTHRIAPGRHEWRFEFTLDPKLPESVEGLAGNYVVYNLSAEIDRGYMSKSLLATKHLRVIRTLSRDMSETVPFPYVSNNQCRNKTLADTLWQSNEDTWAEKIKYHIYIPSRYYAFGTSIPVQFTLIPLKKGVRIGKIKMEVIERVTLETDKHGENWQTTSLSDKIVAKVDQELPPDSSQRLVEESSGIADESYHFKVVLPLQRSLNACRQSVSTDSIKVFHNLKIYVNIYNPDGHISQLCLRNLIHLYISPHMRIGDDQVMAPPSRAMTDPISGLDISADAPPTYGTHLLDQLYDDIDMSGFASGMATPAHFLSRNHSTENLATRLAAALPPSGPVSDSDSSRASSITDSAAIHLQNRLAALHDLGLTVPDTVVPPISRSHSPAPEEHFSRPGIQSGVSSARHSGVYTHQRRRSNSQPHQYLSANAPSTPPLSSPLARPGLSGLASGTRSSPPQAFEFDLNALTRVPSYNTAIRSPYLQHSPNLDGVPELPTYDYVVGLTNAPNTPTTLSTFLPPTPPSDSDSIGNPFNRQNICSPQNKVRGHNRASSELPALPQNALLAGSPGGRRNSNPPLPPNASRSGLIDDASSSSQRRRSSLIMGAGSLSEFWQGMRRGSQ